MRTMRSCAARPRRAAIAAAVSTTALLCAAPSALAAQAPPPAAATPSQVATSAAAAPAVVVGGPAVRPASVATTPWRSVARPTVRQGSHGAAVVALQDRLTALHYDVGPVDGDFGTSTLHGVYAFRKVQGLHLDGIVGPRTWAALATPRVPQPRHTLTASAVEIDLARRVVYLTKNGAVTRIVDASPGKASTPTPTGAFTITRRIDGWRRSPLGLLWRPNYFHEGYALHGSTSVPTYAASHGCVRVTVPAMNRLWPKLFVGEHLWVYR
ncbi:L,D-transpeptidase family protein [Kineosporia sp. R_H_3]|uniref:L,D-transpeptidase family protein n=1 Tax=Kineosporia sp. R_H_3 TaxID=1961848 RepID=UPI0018E99B16|nr:L,D-transpeptidase family protein [Kineosporia sp. R_H_3]